MNSFVEGEENLEEEQNDPLWMLIIKFQSEVCQLKLDNQKLEEYQERLRIQCDKTARELGVAMPRQYTLNEVRQGFQAQPPIEGAAGAFQTCFAQQGEEWRKFTYLNKQIAAYEQFLTEKGYNKAALEELVPTAELNTRFEHLATQE